jgi:hypothetical protein
LNILEYCDISTVIEREQYYLHNLKPEYNILEIAGSPLGRKHTEVTKLKLSANSQAHPLRVINNKTGEIKLFTSIKQTAKILGIHYPSLSIYLRKNIFFIKKEYYITRDLSANKN